MLCLKNKPLFHINNLFHIRCLYPMLFKMRHFFFSSVSIRENGLCYSRFLTRWHSSRFSPRSWLAREKCLDTERDGSFVGRSVECETKRRNEDNEGRREVELSRRGKEPSHYFKRRPPCSHFLAFHPSGSRGAFLPARLRSGGTRSFFRRSEWRNLRMVRRRDKLLNATGRKKEGRGVGLKGDFARP